MEVVCDAVSCKASSSDHGVYAFLPSWLGLSVPVLALIDKLN
jgi:hypothetical protein